MRNDCAAIDPPDATRISLLMITAAWLTDYATKSWAVSMMGEASFELGRLSLEVVANPAFAFSLGHGIVSGEAVALTRAAGVLAVAIFLRTFVGVHDNLRSLTGYALIVAGGLGNTLDHVVQGGAVIDFISLSGVVFNIADLWILLGVVLLYPSIRSFARSAREPLSRIG